MYTEEAALNLTVHVYSDNKRRSFLFYLDFEEISNLMLNLNIVTLCFQKGNVLLFFNQLFLQIIFTTRKENAVEKDVSVNAQLLSVDYCKGSHTSER